MQDWTATMRHGVTRKRRKKGYSIKEICLERTYSQKVSVNSRFKATKIIDQRKAFYRQRVPGSSCARKETVDIDILVTSRNGDRKIMQSIRITSRPPPRKRKWNQLSQFWRRYTKVIPIEKIRTVFWPHFDNEPRFQEKQQVKDQQSCIFLFVVCLTVSSSN